MNSEDKLADVKKVIHYYARISKIAFQATWNKVLTAEAATSLLLAGAIAAAGIWKRPPKGNAWDKTLAMFSELAVAIPWGVAFFLLMWLVYFFKTIYSQNAKLTEQEESQPSRLAIEFTEDCLFDDPDYHIIFRVLVHNVSNRQMNQVQAYCENLKFIGNGDEEEALSYLGRFKNPTPLSIPDGKGDLAPESRCSLPPGASQLFDVIKLNRTTGKLHLCHAVGRWRDAKEFPATRGDINLRGSMGRVEDDTLALGDYKLDVVAYGSDTSPARASFKLTSNRSRNKSFKVELRQGRRELV